MDVFKKLDDLVGEVDLNGQNLGNVGKKTILHITDDACVDAVYSICEHFLMFQERLAKKYREKEGASHEDVEKAELFQARADKISKLIQDKQAYKSRVKRALSYLETLYLTLFDKSIQEEITMLQTSEGRVVIPDKTPIHVTAISQLDGISRGGILASEWFGEFESEAEGRFCCFFSRINGENPELRGPTRGCASLFFDIDSPIAKLLFNLDYFAYEALKAKNPELCKEKFSPEEIELFETLIEPLSPAGTDMYKQSRTASWMAIPGGVPPFLVKGIMLSSREKNLDEIVERCSELFPRAIIFDESKTILHMPKVMT